MGVYSAGLWAGQLVFWFPAGAGNFSLHHHVQIGSGAHSASYPVVLGALSLGIKQLGREAYQSSPSSAEVKEWVEYTSTPLIRLHGLVFSLAQGLFVMNVSQLPSLKVFSHEGWGRARSLRDLRAQKDLTQSLEMFHKEDSWRDLCLSDARFEFLTVVKINVDFFWVVTPYSVGVGYQCFGRPCCLHLQGEGWR